MTKLPYERKVFKLFSPLRGLYLPQISPYLLYAKCKLEVTYVRRCSPDRQTAKTKIRPRVTVGNTNFMSHENEINHCVTNPMILTLHQIKAQMSLGPVQPEVSLCTEVKGPSFLHTGSKDSDHTARMSRLI